MFSEYQDMLFLCRNTLDLSLWLLQDGVFKYIVRHVVGNFLILSLYVMLISHMLACIFIFMEKTALGEDESKDPADWYISVLYFIVTTATTVGFGDITINHVTRRLVFLRYSYQVFLMIFSLFASSSFFSLVTTTVNDAVYIISKMSEPLEDFDVWMKTRLKNMPKTLEVNKFYQLNTTNFKFNYNFNLQSTILFNDFMAQISHEWRSQIKLHTCSDLMSKFKIFLEPLPEDLDHRLLLAMSPRIFFKDDLIVQRREPFPGIYFIIDGEVRVFFRSKANTVYFHTNGEDFGDTCLLKRNSHFSYHCDTDILTMFIPLAELEAILEDFPVYHRFLCRRAQMRRQKLTNTKVKTLVLRSKLNVVKRREGLRDQRPIDKKELLQLQGPSRKGLILSPQVSAIQVKEASEESASEDSSSSSSRGSGEGDGGKPTKQKRTPAILSPSRGNVKPRKINKIVKSKEDPPTQKNQVTPLAQKAVEANGDGIKIDKKLDLSQILQIEMEKLSNEKEVNNNIMTKLKNTLVSPFLRLQAALKSGSSHAQTKLLRSSSIDFEARDEAETKRIVITKVLNGSVKAEAEHSRTRGATLNAQLQKELILASSKTMARERVRDFALSLHKSPLKSQFNVKDAKKTKTKGGQPALVWVKTADESLADDTEEEEVEVGAGSSE